MMKCLLTSGGLDSAAAWWVTGKPPAVYVGGVHGPARGATGPELNALKRMAEACPEFATAFRVLETDMRPFMRRGKWDFPRDPLMLMRAWAAGYDGAMIALVKDDGGGCTQEWIDAKKAEYAGVVGGGFEIDFPVWEWTKAELVERALELGCPREFLQATYSCIYVRPCGRCRGCEGRTEALRVLDGKAQAQA